MTDCETYIIAIENFVDATKQKTACMQEHFRQVCHNCKEYSGCATYSCFVEAWMELQRVIL
jgi:hypothetical protein